MIILEDLLYTEEHIWIRPDKDQKEAMIGLTDYGQLKIGIISSIDLPSIGEEYVETDVFATVENTMGEVTEFLCPMTGKVVAVNDLLIESPEIINEDPYDDGWLMVMDISQPEELDDLMDADEYEKYVEELKIKEEEVLEDDDDILEVID